LLVALGAALAGGVPLKPRATSDVGLSNDLDISAHLNEVFSFGDGVVLDSLENDALTETVFGSLEENGFEEPPLLSAADEPDEPLDVTDGLLLAGVDDEFSLIPPSFSPPKSEPSLDGEVGLSNDLDINAYLNEILSSGDEKVLDSLENDALTETVFGPLEENGFGELPPLFAADEPDEPNEPLDGTDELLLAATEFNEERFFEPLFSLPEFAPSFDGDVGLSNDLDINAYLDEVLSSEDERVFDSLKNDALTKTVFGPLEENEFEELPLLSAADEPYEPLDITDESLLAAAEIKKDRFTLIEPPFPFPEFAPSLDGKALIDSYEKMDHPLIEPTIFVPPELFFKRFRQKVDENDKRRERRPRVRVAGAIPEWDAPEENLIFAASPQVGTIS
jgi:DNA-binding phage protein